MNLLSRLRLAFCVTAQCVATSLLPAVCFSQDILFAGSFDPEAENLGAATVSSDGTLYCVLDMEGADRLYKWKNGEATRLDAGEGFEIVRFITADCSNDHEMLYLGGMTNQAYPAAWICRDGVVETDTKLATLIKQYGFDKTHGKVRAVSTNGRYLLELHPTGGTTFVVMSSSAVQELPSPFPGGRPLNFMDSSKNGNLVYGSDADNEMYAISVVWNLETVGYEVLPHPPVGPGTTVDGGSQTGAFVAGIADFYYGGKPRPVLWKKAPSGGYSSILLKNSEGELMRGKATDVVELNSDALVVGQRRSHSGASPPSQPFMGLLDNKDNWEWRDLDDFISYDKMSTKGVSAIKLFYASEPDLVFYQGKTAEADGVILVFEAARIEDMLRH